MITTLKVGTHRVVFQLQSCCQYTRTQLLNTHTAIYGFLVLSADLFVDPGGRWNKACPPDVHLQQTNINTVVILQVDFSTTNINLYLLYKAQELVKPQNIMANCQVKSSTAL